MYLKSNERVRHELSDQAILQRTKAVLAAAKARGVALGWSIPSRVEEQRQAAIDELRALLNFWTLVSK